MGLYSDPLFFERARGTDQEIASYLNAYLIKNLTLLEEILNSTASQSIDSWYLPAEFDDRYWTSETRTRLLAEQLAKWNSAVSARTQKPWSSSSFFTGWKSPDGYANWLRQIPYKFWIQDGSGTRKLTEEQRLLYLDRIDKNRSRLILEAFEQLSSDANFTAKPRAYKDLQGLERKYESRGFKEVAYFSLRYMPFADGKLKLPSN
ncbi:hypothetical protein MNKW57_11010 [Biformimicrobium ophioploci]|uniref:DUF4434 domain-containing protein n=2 Tax=Biformimicrobium ophioploci TaxID=3036711 RepID=A0ABQ6LXK9_9GAMM|nr:hypothetical protein MNKW57_11010 [Microbulbifer sp. NKW57]